MEKTKKKKWKKGIAAALLAALVLLLAFLPALVKNPSEESGPQASILNGKVALGSVFGDLVGGGSLSESDAEALEVPASVKITRFLVKNGDEVKAGDAIASVDRVTVMTAVPAVVPAEMTPALVTLTPVRAVVTA